MLCTLAALVRWSLSDGNGVASLFGSYQVVGAATFSIRTAYPPVAERPRKGGPNIGCSTIPVWPAAATGLSHSGRKSTRLFPQ